MCNPSCITFAESHLRTEDVEGKSVLEVGSLNVNGTVRDVVERLRPRSYVGVDISPGPGVDQVCDATELIQRFGREAFDLVISTELLEHIRDWPRVISNLKQVLKPGGIILLTTRSYGFGYHGYPYDFWRYEIADVEYLFSDFRIERLEEDPGEPGVFLRARKPDAFSERALGGYALYSIVAGRRIRRVTDFDILLFRVRRLLSRKRWQRVARRAFAACMSKKAFGFSLALLALLVAAVTAFDPPRRVRGGLRGGPIAWDESAYREEYRCLGIRRDFCPPWPDYGCDYLCYGITYGRACFIETYTRQGLQKQPTACR